MGKEHVESSKSRRLKSCSKPPKPFEFKMSSSRRVKQKDADENNAERKEGAKLKYRRRLITRNVITCRENCCDSQTLVSKATDVKDQSEKKERSVSFKSTSLPLPNLHRLPSPRQLCSTYVTKAATKKHTYGNKKRAGLVGSSQTETASSVLRKTRAGTLVPCFRETNTRNPRNNASTSTGLLSSSQGRILRTNQLVYSASPRDNRTHKRTRHQSSLPSHDSISKLTGVSLDVRGSQKVRNIRASSSSSESSQQTLEDISPSFGLSECDTSWMTSISRVHSSTDFPDEINHGSEGKYEKTERDYSSCKDNSKIRSYIPKNTIENENPETSNGTDITCDPEEPSSENEDAMMTLLLNLSRPARECWEIYQKLRQEGLKVPFKTLNRALLTPTEMRELNELKEAQTT
ncbi:uncharacterized protein LOC143227957 [Tachypleus tridentatus]|uniref:uncharacterized protein LOC143227957 n=1 Tax=Tachypleus tridentatus TaxID=6853 RepID=UPI003FD1A8F8